MKTLLTFMLAILIQVSLSGQSKEKNDGWVKLFDGKSFAGWKISEHPTTFTVSDGMIVAYGDRAHLFYDGTVM